MSSCNFRKKVQEDARDIPHQLQGCTDNLIASQESSTDKSDDEVYKNLSSGFLNFINHYCSDDHSSHFCDHDKVTQNNTSERKKFLLNKK